MHTSDHTQELTQNGSQIKMQKPKPLIVSLLTWTTFPGISFLAWLQVRVHHKTTVLREASGQVRGRIGRELPRIFQHVLLHCSANRSWPTAVVTQWQRLPHRPLHELSLHNPTSAAEHAQPLRFLCKLQLVHYASAWGGKISDFSTDPSNPPMWTFISLATPPFV